MNTAERTRFYLADRIDAGLLMTGGEDAHLHDAEGNDYIDVLSDLGRVTLVGHSKWPQGGY